MKKKTIGIIGFGRFGILCASVLSNHFEVKVYHYRKKTLNEKIAEKLHVKLTDFDEVVVCDYLILAVPISNTKKLIRKITKKILPHTVVIDTCSVKKIPCKWMLEILPKENEILGSHPMFGPVTTKFDLEKNYFKLDDKQIVLCPIRISDEKLAEIKQFLKKLKLETLLVSPKEHDFQNAKTLSLVHFLGRSLTNAGIGEQQIFTPGYADLLKILPHTNNDNWQLFFDMNNYNPYAKKVREKFLDSCNKIELKVLRADSQDEFDFNRKKINEIDKKLFLLLEERMRCAEKIGEYKKKNNLEVIDKRREKQIMENCNLNCNLNIHFIKKIYRVIFDESYKQQ